MTAVVFFIKALCYVFVSKFLKSDAKHLKYNVETPKLQSRCGQFSDVDLYNCRSSILEDENV